MRVAVLISGEPRFCTDFDQLMSSFKNYSSIDYFFFLWNKSPNNFSDKRWNLVADSWRNIDIEWARNKIKQNINGHNHNFADLEIGDIDTELEKIPNVGKHPPETNVRNVWLMHTAWSRVNSLKNKKQVNDNFKYDIVINGRLDITIDPLDLELVYKKLSDNDPCVMMVHAPLYGYVKIKYRRYINGKVKPKTVWVESKKPKLKTNDQFTIGLEPIMNTFMTVGQHSLEYSNQGLLFHPETILVHHLSQNSIQILRHDFGLKLRNGLKEGDPFYTSNFAHWA